MLHIYIYIYIYDISRLRVKDGVLELNFYAVKTICSVGYIKNNQFTSRSKHFVSVTKTALLLLYGEIFAILSVEHGGTYSDH